MNLTYRVLVSSFAVFALIVAACGDDDDTGTEATSTSAAPAESEMTITVTEPPGEDGPFVASGAAVDEGTVCAAGATETVSVTDDKGQPAPWSPEPENLLVEKQFTCDDGSGAFTLEIAQPAYSDEHQAAIEAGEVMGEGEETWEVLSGTDAYSTLTGEGVRSWQKLGPEEFELSYQGTVTG